MVNNHGFLTKNHQKTTKKLKKPIKTMISHPPKEDRFPIPGVTGRCHGLSAAAPGQAMARWRGAPTPGQQPSALFAETTLHAS